MDKKFIHNFREIIRIFDRELLYQNNASCCNGISVAQCHTLLEIEKSKKISVSELANKLSLDKSTVSRTVDGLVNISLVDRVTPKENRRKAQLNLTDSGTQVCSTINFTNDQYIKSVLKDFTREEREELLHLFKKLSSKMAELRLLSEDED